MSQYNEESAHVLWEVCKVYSSSIVLPQWAPLGWWMKNLSDRNVSEHLHSTATVCTSLAGAFRIQCAVQWIHDEFSTNQPRWIHDGSTVNRRRYVSSTSLFEFECCPAERGKGRLPGYMRRRTGQAYIRQWFTCEHHFTLPEGCADPLLRSSAAIAICPRDYMAASALAEGYTHTLYLSKQEWKWSRLCHFHSPSIPARKWRSHSSPLRSREWPSCALCGEDPAGDQGINTAVIIVNLSSNQFNHLNKLHICKFFLFFYLLNLFI